ncbi:hypothetical protein M445_12200 [Vibrio owensii 47666-1]|uniref:hypothetical protein n=1 Tax=Vibrio owensii TaxID=696485 RepID=UPI0005856E8A|nr:hypothetical protein [Vibrio owensii]KIF47743.1 hypothetical protein M445_12200 [Vibrio owensii 47666-1]
MKKLVLIVLMVISTFSHAVETKFKWKGTIPAASTYIQNTILHDPKFDISDYSSLTFVKHKVDANKNINLITLAEF